MARYRVVEKSFVNQALVDEGAEIEYDPPEGTTVSENLELIEDEPKPARKAKAAAEGDAALA